MPPIQNPNKPEHPNDTLYKQFEYLAKHYASRLFNYETTGWEKEDLVQEMKLKVFTSIIAYRKKWREYARTKRYKPITFEIYLRNALDNKVTDFIKKFNKGFQGKGRISIQENEFDCGFAPTEMTVIDFSKNIYIVKGVDLLDGLSTKEEKMCFSLFLKQKPMPIIKKILKNKPINPKEVIEKQVERLKVHKDELLYRHDHMYKNFSIQD